MDARRFIVPLMLCSAAMLLMFYLRNPRRVATEFRREPAPLSGVASNSTDNRSRSQAYRPAKMVETSAQQEPASNEGNVKASAASESNAVISLNALTNRGSHTPAAALETFLWALTSAPSEVTNLIRYLDQSDASSRVGDGKPFDADVLVALSEFVSKQLPQQLGRELAGIRILDEQPSDGYTRFNVLKTSPSGEDAISSLAMVREGNEWRLLITLRSGTLPDTGDSYMQAILFTRPSSGRTD